MIPAPSAADFAAWPARPPSEVEWEEILVRVEVFPRILRGTLGEAAGGVEQARHFLEALVSREMWLSGALEALREVGRVEPEWSPVLFAGEPPDAETLLEKVEGLRARVFARVQRRGLEVWDWSAAWGDGGETVTAYQLLRLMEREDGEVLTVTRIALRED